MTFSLQKMINATIYIGTRKQKKKKEERKEKKKKEKNVALFFHRGLCSHIFTQLVPFSLLDSTCSSEPEILGL